MSQRKMKAQKSIVQDISIVDLLLFDHQYLKQCIKVLSDEKEEAKKKLTLARGFVDALQKHSLCEKKIVYGPLKPNEELHFNILEAEVEHGIVDQKVKSLKRKLARVRTLKDEVEAELKVLAELVQHHLKEEESEMLPKMREHVDEETLNEMGAAFMRMRSLTPKDFRDYPLLEDELVQWKDSVQRISSQFLAKMDKYVENMKH